MPARRPVPRPGAARTPARESDESMRARGVTPFLRPEHVSSGEVLMLTGFNYMKDGQFCVTVAKLTNPEIDWVLGIREGSPDHKKFFKAFGNNTISTWAPGNVTIEIAKGTRPGYANEVEFVNVREIEPL